MTSVSTTQQSAFTQAYKFLTQGIRAKLSRDVNGIWTGTEVSTKVLTEVLEVVE